MLLARGLECSLQRPHPAQTSLNQLREEARPVPWSSLWRPSCLRTTAGFRDLCGWGRCPSKAWGWEWGWGGDKWGVPAQPLPSVETPRSPELGPMSRPSSLASSGFTSRHTMVDLPFKVLSAQTSASMSKLYGGEDSNAPGLGGGRRIRDSRRSSVLSSSRP